MEIIKAHAIKNLCYITSNKMVPKGIVVHSTGANNPYLKRYVDAPDALGVNSSGNHWNTAKPGGREVCVHAFIGYDKNNAIKVAEILPLNICCWGVGSGKKGSYNFNPPYIQFEICEDGLKDAAYYKKVFSVAAEYCAELCRTYSISVDKIVGHCEAYRLGYGSNHSDPEHWMKNFGESMGDFRKKVSEILKNIEKKQSDTNAVVVKTASIEKGDLVSIADNATYYSGATIPTWVKSQNWYVLSISNGDRVVIDKNEKGTNSICSPINKKFLKIIKKAKSSASKSSEIKASASDVPYLVKITADSISIYKNPGANNTKVGTITDRGVYTIVEEKIVNNSEKWGRLKSGVGWISLKNTKKI